MARTAATCVCVCAHWRAEEENSERDEQKVHEQQSSLEMSRAAADSMNGDDLFLSARNKENVLDVYVAESMNSRRK